MAACTRSPLCSAPDLSALHQTFALPSPDHPLFYSAPDQSTAPDHLSALLCSSLQQIRALHQIFGLRGLHQITPLHNSAPDLLRLYFILHQTFALTYTEFHFALHCTRSLLCCSCTRSPPALLCTRTFHPATGGYFALLFSDLHQITNMQGATR